MLTITFLWCVSLAVVRPLGDFPLNDDWVYGLIVKHFLGIVHHVSVWGSPTSITNALWGSLFCIPVGFSFNALRLSTLILSLLGVFGTYFLMRELHQPRWLALTAALVLAFNPIYYALSNTFMTDVPFTAIAVAAALFLVRNLRSASDLDLLIGTTLAVAATLSRQMAISIPMAFAVTLVLKRGMTRRNMLRAATPLVLCLGTLLVFWQWLSARGFRLGTGAVNNVRELPQMLTKPHELIFSFVQNTYVALLYLGWFLMPVLVFAVASTLRSDRKKSTAILITSIGLLAVMCARFACRDHFFVMPLSNNIIVKSGIGPLTLRDAFILGLKHVHELPHDFWRVVTVIGLLGAAFLSTAIGVSVFNLAPRLRPGKMGDNEAARTFLLLSVAIYLLPLLVGGYFDRYLIFAVPFLAASIPSYAPGPPRASTTVSRFAAAVFLIASCLFAVLGTKDYLAWNRVRWEALDELIGTGTAKVEEIDGGYEFNGLYLYNSDYKGDSTKSWWWVQGDTYQIAFGDVPGYRVIKEYNYRHWMPPCVGKVVVLQRDTLTPR
jgi:4-amino-4-deoxy-L-arabinose transferase-like glycosyltransferase